ncbi:MAG: YihY/virulence factor BrkB family protein, partial [Actinomycetota bacterium]
VLLDFFAVFRWVMIFLALQLGFALIYYLGPDVKQEFKFITPGSFLAVLLDFFAVFRWVMIFLALQLGFALIYYLGPDVKQEFKFITPGSILAVLLLIAASLVFKFYATHFGNYSATYGSIGAVIILMFWLYIAGLVILLGSEINALVEHYAPGGKEKGEKVEGQHGRRAPGTPPPPPRRS